MDRQGGLLARYLDKRGELMSQIGPEFRRRMGEFKTMGRMLRQRESLEQHMNESWRWQKLVLFLISFVKMSEMLHFLLTWYTEMAPLATKLVWSYPCS